MNPFKHKEKTAETPISVVFLRDGTEEEWANCWKASHVPTTFQYGAHPMRVYQFCPFCHIKSRLEWKDTYARTMNRIWTTTPAVITGGALILTIAFILWAAAHIP